MDSTYGVKYVDLLGEYDMAINEPTSFDMIMVDNIGENTTNNNVQMLNNLQPYADNTLTLGTTGAKWSTVYANNISVTTSTQQNIRLTDTSNQITLGATGNTLIISGTGASGAVYKIPNVGMTGSFVMTEGQQTVNGLKTYSSTILSSTPGFQFQFHGTGDGTYPTYLYCPAPTGGMREVRIADSGTNLPNEIILQRGPQTIIDQKTFSSAVKISPTSNQLIFGSTGNTVTISATGASGATYNISNTGLTGTFIMDVGAQTIDSKTFTNMTNVEILQRTSASVPSTCVGINKLADGNAYFDHGGTASVGYVFRNMGGTGFLGSITNNGVVSQKATFTNTSNQLAMGLGGNTITISASAPVSPRIYTLPDLGTDSTFAFLGGTIQTFDGLKVFSSPIPITATSNQLQLGTGNKVILSAPTPASGWRTYTFPDATENANILLSSVPSGQVLRVLSNGTNSYLNVSGSATAPGKPTGFQFQRNDSIGIESTIGLASASNEIVNGSGAGDICVQTFSNILLGTSSQACLKMDTIAVNVPLTTDSTSRSTGALVVNGGIGCTGNIFANGVSLVTSGGTATVMNYFEEATHVTTFTGPFTSASFTIYVKRINNRVSITFKPIQGTATVSAQLVSATALPTKFRPAYTQTYGIRGISGSTIQMITGSVRSDGVIAFYNLNGTNFSSGTCGTAGTGFSYDIDIV